MTFEIVAPTLGRLRSYVQALERGWSPDNVRAADAVRDQLDAIDRDPAAFVEGLDDREARGAPIVLPDGSTVERLPGFHRWLWDEEFCGSIGFRWRIGAPDLPAHVLGHIGYAVVPWKQRRGYATCGLGLLLCEVRAIGLPYVELTTDLDNLPSQKVILANGGRLVDQFAKPAAYGGAPSLRFRIDL
jgi:predicted acetyltransferase